jgi:hypothetical protein
MPTREEVIKEIDLAFDAATMPKIDTDLTTFNDIDATYVIKGSLAPAT